MTSQEFRTALRGDQRIYGTLLVSPSPFWPKVIGDCGLDFVFIDTEHIAIGRETLSWMCRTYAALGLPPLVRITDPDPYKVTVAYDDGAAGVVAPYIETPEQVRALVGASKFRPLKGEKLQRALDGAGHGGDQHTRDRAHGTLALTVEREGGGAEDQQRDDFRFRRTGVQRIGTGEGQHRHVVGPADVHPHRDRTATGNAYRIGGTDIERRGDGGAPEETHPPRVDAEAAVHDAEVEAAPAPAVDGWMAPLASPLTS